MDEVIPTLVDEGRLAPIDEAQPKVVGRACARRTPGMRTHTLEGVLIIRDPSGEIRVKKKDAKSAVGHGSGRSLGHLDEPRALHFEQRHLLVVYRLREHLPARARMRALRRVAARGAHARTFLSSWPKSLPFVANSLSASCVRVGHVHGHVHRHAYGHALGMCRARLGKLAPEAVISSTRSRRAVGDADTEADVRLQR